MSHFFIPVKLREKSAKFEWILRVRTQPQMHFWPGKKTTPRSGKLEVGWQKGQCQNIRFSTTVGLSKHIAFWQTRYVWKGAGNCRSDRRKPETVVEMIGEIDSKRYVSKRSWVRSDPRHAELHVAASFDWILTRPTSVWRCVAGRLNITSILRHYLSTGTMKHHDAFPVTTWFG